MTRPAQKQMTRKVQVVLTEDQYRHVVTAATEVTLAEGRPCSLSEWLRRFVEEDMADGK